jgi:hypothetical protein
MAFCPAGRHPLFYSKVVANARAAEAMQSNPAIESIDPTLPLDTHTQVMALARRMARRAADAVGVEDDSKQRFNIGSGAADAQTAVRGITTAICTQGRKTYTPPEVSSTARRSFGVVRQLAIYQATHQERAQTIPPEYLTLVEDPVSFVRFGEAVEGELTCPAFFGDPDHVPRMPVQLFSHVINIYEACGEFQLTE